MVTLALAYDIDQIAEKAGLAAGQLADAGCPTTARPTRRRSCCSSARGTPRRSRTGATWLEPGVSVITPNPKTSGGARWNYLAAWAWALRQPGGNEASAKEFVGKLYKNVPVLDAGARGSTTTFVERGIGDVLIAWENEALLAIKELGPGKFEVVAPSLSILAEPPVAVVDKVAGKHGTKAVAQAYLEYLYTAAGQEIAAKHFYRPRIPTVAAKYAAAVPQGESGHRRRGLRRLEEGARHPLRRRRAVRSDLPAGALAPAACLPLRRDDDAAQVTERAPRVRSVPGDHLHLPEPDGAPAPGRPSSRGPPTCPGRSSGARSPTRGCWPPTG